MKNYSGFVFFWCIFQLSFGLVASDYHTYFHRVSGIILNYNFSSDVMDTRSKIRQNLSEELFVQFKKVYEMVNFSTKQGNLLNVTAKEMYFTPPSNVEATNTSLIKKTGNYYEKPEIGVYFLMLLKFDFDIETPETQVHVIREYLKGVIFSYLLDFSPCRCLGGSLYINITSLIIQDLPTTEASRIEDVLKYKNHYVASLLYQSRGISKENLDVLSILSYVGCGLSLFGLTLTITTILFSRKLRRMRANQILVQMCVALLGALLFYTFGIRQIKNQDEIETCKALSAMLHYFLLASILWASVEAYNLYQDLVKVFDTSVLTQNEFMCRASLIGWVPPGIVVCATVVISDTSYGFHVFESEEHTLCWMRRDAFYFSLLLPVLLLVLMNTVIFVIVMREIFKMPQAHEKRSKMAQFRATVSVFILLGLNWIFAGLAAISPTLVLQYPFTITCSFQGFFIFVLHGILKKDFQEAWSQITTQNRVMEIIRSSHLSQKTTSSSISRNSMVPSSTMAYGNNHDTPAKFNSVGELDSGIDIRPKSDQI